jgi:hypothetical protein
MHQYKVLRAQLSFKLKVGAEIRATTTIILARNTRWRITGNAVYRDLAVIIGTASIRISIIAGRSNNFIAIASESVPDTNTSACVAEAGTVSSCTDGRAGGYGANGDRNRINTLVVRWNAHGAGWVTVLTPQGLHALFLTDCKLKHTGVIRVILKAAFDKRKVGESKILLTTFEALKSSFGLP